MNRAKLVLLSFVFLIALALPTYAANCGTYPTNLGSNVLGCVALTFNNPTGTATTAGYTQMINFNGLSIPANYISSSKITYALANSLSGATTPVWVQAFNAANELTVNGITSNMILEANIPDVYTGNDVNWELVFVTNGVNLAATPNAMIGVAPQDYCASGCAQTTYGQYDNGRAVFPFYANYSGNSLGSQFTLITYSGSGQTTIISNSLESYSGTSSGGSGVYTNNAFNPQTDITDSFMYATPISGSSNLNWMWDGGSPPNGCPQAQVFDNSGSYALHNFNSGCSNGGTTNIAGGSSSTYQIMTLWESASESFASINYGATTSVSTDFTASTSSHFEEFAYHNGGTITVYIQWTDIRIAPPNDQMPTVSFGAFQTVSTGGSPTISASPTSGTYPIVSTLTATCTPNTDTCDIDSPLGNHLATGTGSASYTTALATAVGTYTYYANDITSGLTASTTFTINKNTSIQSCTYRGNTASNGITLIELFASGIISCSSLSYNSQILSTLTQNGVTVGSGATATFNAVWDDANNIINWAYTTSANYTANSLTFNLNYVPYVLISATVPTKGYETNTYTGTYVINLTQSENTATMALSVNNNVVASNTQKITGFPQTFSLSYTLPLLTQNGVTWPWNSMLTLTVPSTFIVNPIASNTQTEVWNYIPNVQSKNANIILGENQTIFVNTTDIENLGLATYSGVVKIGTKTASELSSIQYHAYALIYSFIPQNYGYPKPGYLTQNELITANAVVQYTFNGNSVYRNVSTTFFATNESLITCGSPTTLTWQFFNASTSGLWNIGNVLLEGTYNISENTWNVLIPGTSVGFPPIGTGTSNHYSTCIFPTWANFDVSGYYVYNASGLAQSNFYLKNFPVSNTLQFINLTLGVYPNPETYDIAVQNTQTGGYISELVQIQQLIPSNNVGVVINELLTPQGGTAQTYLSILSRYRFGVYNPSTGQLLKLTNYLQAQSCGSPPCLIVIPLNASNVTTLGNQINNIVSSCNQINVNSTGPPISNITTINCTYSSINGATYIGTLVITPNSAFNNTAKCSTQVQGSAGSLVCNANDTNDTVYNWAFSLNIGPNGSYIVINQGSFGVAGPLFGLQGLYWAFVIVIFFASFMASKNVVIAVSLADAAMIGAWFIQLIQVPVAVLGALQILTVFIIYIVTRNS